MTSPARPKRRLLARLFLALLIAATMFVAMRLGYIPQRLSPFSPISLDTQPSWFVDTRLAALRLDRPLCEAVLKQPHIDAVGCCGRQGLHVAGHADKVRVGNPQQLARESGHERVEPHH